MQTLLSHDKVKGHEQRYRFLVSTRNKKVSIDPVFSKWDNLNKQKSVVNISKILKSSHVI